MVDYPAWFEEAESDLTASRNLAQIGNEVIVLSGDYTTSRYPDVYGKHLKYSI